MTKECFSEIESYGFTITYSGNAFVTNYIIFDEKYFRSYTIKEICDNMYGDILYILYKTSDPNDEVITHKVGDDKSLDGIMETFRYEIRDRVRDFKINKLINEDRQ